MYKGIRFLVVIFFTSFIIISCEKDEKDEIIADENIYGKWEVVDFMSIESMLYAKNNDYNPTIEFKPNGSLLIKLDINSCFGSFEISEYNSIAISEVGCTEACCDSDFSSKFISMLNRVESYEFDEENLRLNVPAWGWIALELQ